MKTIGATKPASVILDRIDAIVLEVDATETVKDDTKKPDYKKAKGSEVEKNKSKDK